MNQSEMEIKIAVLESENRSANVMFSKFESAVDKLVEATTTIKDLLAAHDAKILVQQGEVTSIRNSNLELKANIQDQIKNINCHVDKNKARIEKLEHWRWIVIGAATAVGVILEWVYKLFAK